MAYRLNKVYSFIFIGIFMKSACLSTAYGTCTYPFIHWSGNCYLFRVSNTDDITWNAAVNFCSSITSFKGSLTTILSPEEQQFLYTYARSLNPNMHVWIGMYKVHRGLPYVWYDGTPTDYTNWAPGEPNDVDGTHNCVRMYSFNGMWDDYNCGALYENHGYICKYKLDEPTSTDPTTTLISSPSSGSSTTSSSGIGDPPPDDPGCCNAGQVVGITLGFFALVGLIMVTIYITKRLRGGQGVPFFAKSDGAPPPSKQTSAAIPPNNSIRNPNYEDVSVLSEA